MEELAFPILLGNTYIKLIDIGGNFCIKLSLPARSFVRIIGTRTSTALSNEMTVIADDKKKIMFARVNSKARIDEFGNIYLGFAGNLESDTGSWNIGILMSNSPISVELVPKENRDEVLSYDSLQTILI